MNYRTVEVAGKTGTGEVGLPDRWHSWFVAYAPYNAKSKDEQIVVSVIVEAANKWEWWATYATAIIMQGYFANQTYEQAVLALRYNHLATVQERIE
jgi:penicillin-binding protein 2